MSFNTFKSRVKMPRVGVVGREQHISLGLGAAATQLGNAVMAQVDKAEAGRRIDDFNQDTLAFSIKLNDSGFDRRNGDWRGSDEGFAVDNEALLSDFMERQADDKSGAKFETFAKRAIANAEFNLKGHNYKKEKNSRIDTFNANITSYSDQYLKVETEDERLMLEGHVNDAFDVMAIGGWITPEAATSGKKSWAATQTFEMGKILVRSDPHGVLDDLGGAKIPVAPRHIASIIKNAAAGSGVSESYLTITAKRESSFNPAAKAETSSASGLFQFTKGTWKDVTRAHGGEMPFSASMVAKINTEMAVHFAADNKAYVEGVLGRPITDGELYIAHFMGRGGGAKFLQAYAATPGALAADLFRASAKANQRIFYHKSGKAKTVAEVYAERVKPYGGAGKVGKVSDAYDQMTFKQQQSLRVQAQKQIGLLNADADAQLGLIGKNIAAGIAPLQSQINDLAALGASIGRDDIVEQASAMQDLSGLADDWQQASIVDVQNDVAALTLAATGEGASAGDVMKAQFGIQKLAVMEKAVKADPIAYAIAAGHDFVEPIAMGANSLDTANVASFEAALAARAGAAGKISNYYGGDKRLFSNGERQALSNLYDGADLAGKEKLSGMLFTSFGADMPKFLNEMAKNGPANAQTIWLGSIGSDKAAQLSHVGAIALRDKTVKMPSKNDVNLAFNEFVGVAIPTQQTQMRGAILQVAKQIYAGKIVTGLVTGDDMDVQAFTDSVDEALGKTANGGGIAKQSTSYFGFAGIEHSYLLPSQLTLGDVEAIDENVTADNFGRLIGSAEPMHADGGEFGVDELAGAYKINVGHGKYNISLTDPNVRLELVIDGAGGQALELDYNDMDVADFPSVAAIKPPRAARRFHSPEVKDFIPEEKSDNLYDYLRNGPLSYAIDVPATANIAGNKFDYEAAKLLKGHLNRGGYAKENKVVDLGGLKKKIENLSKKYPDNKHQAQLMSAQIQMHLGGE